MRMRYPASVILAAAVAVAGAARLGGQTSAPKPRGPTPAGSTPQAAETTRRAWTAPRTPWGDPDIEGLWPGTDFVGVPLQRPRNLGTRNELTDEEFAARLKAFEAQADEDNADFDIDKLTPELIARGT